MCGCGSGDCFNGFGTNTPGCSYNTPMNTLGVGDLVSAGAKTLGNDFRQMPPRRHRNAITGISAKRPAPIPFVTPGTNGPFPGMRPLFVPHGPSGRPKKR